MMGNTLDILIRNVFRPLPGSFSPPPIRVEALKHFFLQNAWERSLIKHPDHKQDKETLEDVTKNILFVGPHKGET